MFCRIVLRNDVLISIVTVPKTIHIVMVFFFTIALPSGFYYEKTELLSQEVLSAMGYVYFSSLFALNQRPVIALFMYFFIKIPPHYCRRSRL